MSSSSDFFPKFQLCHRSSPWDRDTSNLTWFKLNSHLSTSLFSSACQLNEFITLHSSCKWNREAKERTREIVNIHPIVKMYFNSQQRNETHSPTPREVLYSARSPENELRSQFSSSEPSESLIIRIFDPLRFYLFLYRPH